MSDRTRMHELKFEAFVRAPEHFEFDEHDKARLSEVLDREIAQMFRDSNGSLRDEPTLLSIQPAEEVE